VIVGVGAWRGVGATSTAVLIASRLVARGERPWLIEADPAGGVLAARLELADVSGALESIAFPAQRGPSVDRFAQAATTWCGIRVVGAPGDPFRAWTCHQPRLAWAPTLRELDGPVIVDLGRVRGGGPIDALLQQLDVLLMISSADIVDLVSTNEWATLHGRAAATDHGLAVDIARVVVVDAPIATTGSRATRSMVDYELGDRLAGWLPWSSDALDLVRRGVVSTDRRLRRQLLIGATDHLVDRLRAWVPLDVHEAAR
jgi:hypothetical protein